MYAPRTKGSRRATICAKSSENQRFEKMDSQVERIFKAIKDGKNICVTGKAGTGKSTLLKRIMQENRDKLVFCVAPTGVAAMNIGGTTIHSYLGIHANAESYSDMLQASKFNKFVRERIAQTDMLIIDEISMVSGDFLENASEYVRRVRSKVLGIPFDEAFGGIQVLMFGDFFQLPPIVKEKKVRYVEDVPCKFAFECSIWPQLAEETFQLTKVYRQADKMFCAILGGIRVLEMYKSDLKVLDERQKAPVPDGVIKLVCVNDIANNINHQELAKLPRGPQFTFKAVYKGYDGLFDKLKDDMKALQLEEITYKPGARVMLRRNVDQTKKLVNGSLGVIQSLDAAGSLVVKMDDVDEPVAFPVAIWSYKRKAITRNEKLHADNDGYISAEVHQMPFTFAWAISIHKSQGITLDRALVDLDRCFEDHQVYVALSRLRSLDGLYLRNFSMDKIKVNKKVKTYYKGLAESTVRRGLEQTKDKELAAAQSDKTVM